MKLTSNKIFNHYSVVFGLSTTNPSHTKERSSESVALISALQEITFK